MGKLLKRILPLALVLVLGSTAGVLAFTDGSGWLRQLPARVVALLRPIGSGEAPAVTGPADATSPTTNASASASSPENPTASMSETSPADIASAPSPTATPTPATSTSATPISPTAAPSEAASSEPVSGTPVSGDPASAAAADTVADATTGPALSLSVERMRQGDLVAVWLDHVPPDLEEADIRFRASWLKNPVAAYPVGDRRIALIQATVSVSPNLYSVRAVTVGRDASGAALPPVEIPGTKKLIRIADRAFEQQIFSVSKELEQTRSDDNLAADAEKVAKAKANPSAVPLWQARFQMPIEGGVAKSFGKQRIINGKLNYTHSGVDISATEGTPIHAPAAGRVVFSGALIVSGNTVILDHGLGMFSSLVHMSKTAATVGQTVTAGEVVGYVGATGFATGPHLHWTLTVRGNIVDPECLIRLDPLSALRSTLPAD